MARYLVGIRAGDNWYVPINRQGFAAGEAAPRYSSLAAALRAAAHVNARRCPQADQARVFEDDD